MGIFTFSLIVSCIISASVGQGNVQPLVQPGGDQCTYTFTVPASQVAAQCLTAEIQNLVSEVRAEYQKVKAENAELKSEVEKLRKEYGGMVDTVKKLEKGTSSWREIVEWPVFDEKFRPNNLSLLVQESPSFQDCHEAYKQGKRKQGIYSLEPKEASRPFLGFCDGEGWTVIQRRFDGTVDFHRKWDEYSSGFGELSGEFWLGLENIHMLSKDRPQELRAELLGWNGKLYTAVYDNFGLGGEMEEYVFSVGNMSKGNYLDVLTELNGVKFTSQDKDNDGWHQKNCAKYYRGGWWLQNCGWDLHRPWCDTTGCMKWGDKIVKKSVLKIRPMEARGDKPQPKKPQTRKPVRTRKPKLKKPKKVARQP